MKEPTIFSLKDGAKAHCLLESRKSVGKIIGALRTEGRFFCLLLISISRET
jgi:hypothetical protein